MDFRIKGLSADPFRSLYGLSDEDLAAKGVIRYMAEPGSGFSDRIEMRDAKPGETMLLLNHTCQPADSPYRATHAIFIREGAEESFDQINVVPEVMLKHLLSLRGFSKDGMILDADVVEGAEMKPVIARLFENSDIAYIHAHNAKQGCFSGVIERA